MAATNNAYRNARKFRRALSMPEKLLWVRLRGASPRIRRQHPIGTYVLDFYCPAAKLAIEVDGAAHDFGNRPQRDEVRTQWLAAEGVDVLRIPAKQVLSDPDEIADSLIKFCADRAGPLHHPPSPPATADGPPPHACGAGRSQD